MSEGSSNNRWVYLFSTLVNDQMLNFVGNACETINETDALGANINTSVDGVERECSASHGIVGILASALL
ncbi:hypothetical protein BDY19DRAFT_945099 [Irpex rosettiformis]|uniref:Uncharacterized protein n=1 Tax=Irpex rosettiformis TaxID=378272 RepID=A0ACB8U4Y7_9APHY|nr:hypothetical protein BDY19DRAFT_945099 [Irpex rosettiformis]